uniref:Pre-rRNA-processing protein TSR2 homolog n=1 Tax=Lutzomyia longipalpis TaxID=7200 RepID=A0A1B0C8A1_LUTLO
MAGSNEPFREIVENIFNRWSALKLAVEHGMGGWNGLQKAIELMNHTYDYCVQPKTPAQEDIQDALDEYLDQEFQTICDDNSSQEVSYYLIRYLTMFRAGQFAEITNELNQLPPVNKWLLPGHKITYVAVQEDSSSESETEEHPRQQIGAFTVTDLPEGFAPSTSGATMEMQEEDVEPGWTKVTTKSRRKH